MGRIRNTIELAKSSWRVLKADKELLLLPIMSAIATIIVAATFLVPLFWGRDLDAEQSLTVIDYVALFIMYISLAYVTIFFNAGLVHAANERLSGGDPTVGSALRGASHRAGRILSWAIVSATVSVILRALEERAGTLGRIVIGLVGVAWSLATFLVVPVLVMEDTGAIESVKRSGSLFKRTWGENVASQVGFGLIGFLAALPAIIVAVLGIGAGGAVMAFSIAIAVAWIALVSVVIAALSAIFQTALYRYAVAGEVPQGYAPTAFNTAFGPKGGW